MQTDELAHVAESLRAGRLVADRTFDRVYPERLRKLSAKFWTPVAVAMRAARMLVEGGATRVLDVGAGVGKFCIVGALATGRSFTGVECDLERANAAQLAARAYRARGVTIVHERADRISLAGFDGFYLFNPFAEVLEPNAAGLPGKRAALGYRRDVRRIQSALAQARQGARVVTYYGFGGPLPAGYRLVADETCDTGPLACWEQTLAPPKAA